ncbi:MAG: 4'-phosphopantetheinyl transferase superfamily protein [Flavobacteriales bacterium]|jgi:4'-phosphopantetheinyl transferase|nr:4'-phosphopantetheinyl transferase superfamily protein [Flavobacteriales bacterium]
MSLLFLKKDGESTIAVWKITESFENLNTKLYQNEINKFKSNKRKLEYICTRLLLNVIDKKLKISYNKYGAPILNNNKYISISHTKKLIAIVINKNKVGADVELISQKILKIKSRFISNNDNVSSNTENLTLAWSAKECIFKWHQKGNINFKEDIQINKIIKDPNFEIYTKFQNQELILNYEEINNHFLVYFCK